MDASHFPERWERGRDQSRPWMFLVSSPSRVGDLPQTLGMTDYSYGFVVKSLAPVLERLGHWRQVIAPKVAWFMPPRRQSTRVSGRSISR